MSLHDFGNFGERQTPSVKDFGYLAHLSIYDFAAKEVVGKSFLDVGTGTGYGASYIAEKSAGRVVGLERDADLVAELNAAATSVEYLQCDLDHGNLPVDEKFDIVFTSNVFEHVAYPDAILAEFNRVVEGSGRLIFAVPPIPNIGMLRENAKNIFHINNLPWFVWQSKLERYFSAVKRFRHWVVDGKHIDNRQLIRDAITDVEHFAFSEVTRSDDDRFTITAVFACDGPRATPLPPSHEVGIPDEWRHLRVEADGRQQAFIELNRRVDEAPDFIKKEIRDSIDWARAQDPSSTEYTLRSLLDHLAMLSK